MRQVLVGVSDARKEAKDKANEKGIKHSVYIYNSGERWEGYYRVVQGDSEQYGMTLHQTFEPDKRIG